MQSKGRSDLPSGTRFHARASWFLSAEVYAPCVVIVSSKSKIQTQGPASTPRLSGRPLRRVKTTFAPNSVLETFMLQNLTPHPKTHVAKISAILGLPGNLGSQIGRQRQRS